MQKETQNNLYLELTDVIPKSVLTKKNKARTWLYGYNEKYDVIVISKTGQDRDWETLFGITSVNSKYKLF